MGESAKVTGSRWGRHYQLADGTELPSVTTVLRQLAAPQLEQWKLNQVAGAAVDTSDWREQDRDTAIEMILAAGKGSVRRAAARGTTIHKMLEEGKTADEVPAAQVPYLLAATKALELVDGVPMGAEWTLTPYPVQPFYAGTADLLYLKPNDGGIGVLDWKSKADPTKTSGYHNDALQLAALAMSSKRIMPDGTLVDLPDEIVELTIVAIKSDGTCDVRTISEPGTITMLQQAFMGLASVNELMAEHRWAIGMWDESTEGASL